MRLSCPNCDAQYEVADDAIPSGGRDVQCSNCGHAWFQSQAAEMAEDDEDEVVPRDAPEAPLPSVAAMSPRAQEDDDDEDDVEPAMGQPRQPAPRPVDESVLTVLREEAERETAARRRDAELAQAASATAAATQPAETTRATPIEPFAMASTPISAPAPIAAPVVTNSAFDDDAMDSPGMAGSRAGKRRELLPDIDAINSTLRGGTDRSIEMDDESLPPPLPEPARSGGFRGGFLLTVGVGILLAVLYVTAPAMAARFPAAGPVLGAYVMGIDDARLWLDGLARRAGDSLGAGQSDAVTSD